MEYAAFSETLNGAPLGAPVGDSIVLLGDFNEHPGDNGDNWRGVILFFIGLASHKLFIINSKFEYIIFLNLLGTRVS